ncbi:MAG: hypothetical protein FJ091_13565 [Deltaproteobacteria bacterium]|nr:hypothetical protein [Deltaproteobacteria bacterium]
MPTYSYNLQFAEFDPRQVDDRGVASAREILEAFDAFDWAGQIVAANRLQKVSPTFSVLDIEEDRLFWVSGCGEPDDMFFVNDYSYRGEVRRLFGLLSSRGRISAPTRELSLAEARRAVEIFATGGHESLLRLLSSQ